jgi:hypothetical protein
MPKSKVQSPESKVLSLGGATRFGAQVWDGETPPARPNMSLLPTKTPPKAKEQAAA